MEIKVVTQALRALSQETRLAIFRLLVSAGPEGINAGDIAKTLALPLATFSFHVAQLVRFGLVTSRQESRFIYYVANFLVVDELIAFLTENCCQGAKIKKCLPKTQKVNTIKKRRSTQSNKSNQSIDLRRK